MHSTPLPPPKSNDRLTNIYLSILDRNDLTTTEKLICSCLVSKIHFKAISFSFSSNAFGKSDEYIKLSSKDIANSLGMNQRNISKAIKKLIESEVIEELPSIANSKGKAKEITYGMLDDVNESLKLSIPNSILSNKEINCSCKLVYAKYYSFSDGPNKTAHNIRMCVIESSLGIGSTSSRKAIKKLAEHGLISVEKVKNKVLVKVLKQTENKND